MLRVVMTGISAKWKRRVGACPTGEDEEGEWEWVMSPTWFPSRTRSALDARSGDPLLYDSQFRNRRLGTELAE